MKKFRFFSILTLVGLMLTTNSSNIKAASIEFTDSNLQSCVNNALETSGITAENISNLKRLDCSSKNISSLDGIEQLENLEYLYLNNNSISEIDQLEYLENLKYLQLYSNDIESVQAISSLINLRQLLIDDNNISDISALSTLDSLIILSANDNQISVVDSLSGLVNLKELSLVNNSIKNISSLEALTNLEKLRLENNSIANINSLSNLTNLQTVYLSNNQITSLAPLSGMTKLTELFVDNNKLSSLSGIENMTNLSSLRASGNTITNLPNLTNLVSLKNVELSANQISDVSPLAKLPAVSNIQINENAISDMSSLKNVTSLRVIAARNQTITLKPATVSSTNPIEYTVTDIKGTTHPVSLKIVKSGTDTLESKWKANQINSYFSGTVIQNVNYKPQSRLSGKSKATANESNVYSDSQLINLFEMKNSKGSTISVDKSGVDFKTPGTYPVVFTDADLNVVNSKLVIKDVVPKITVETESIDIIMGQRITDYASVYGAVATEITTGDLQDDLQIDDSNVKYLREGSYFIEFKVSDKQNNTTRKQVKLNISKRKFTINYPGGGRLNLYKTSRFGAGLPDYEYTIYDKDGNVIEVIVTDENGFVQSTVLPPGDYYIEQTGAPNGEPIVSDRLSVTETISIVNVGDDNTNNNGNGNSDISVNINGNNVGQVGVYLTGEDGSLVDYSVSDEDGNVNFEDVASGTYRLILDGPSNSFFDNTDEHKIVVSESEDGQQFDFFVKTKGLNLIAVGIVFLLIGLVAVAIRYFLKKQK